MPATRLADTFLENAAGFVRYNGRGQADVYGLCIAIELMMKAAILHRGGSDDRNRREIRHNLRIAIEHASNIGLAIDPALAVFAARYSAFYETHTLTSAPQLAGDELAALAIVAHDQLAAVQRFIGADADCGAGDVVR